MGNVDATDEIKKTDLLIWRFADNDGAANAFDQLWDSGNNSVSRLGNVVFTSLPSESRDELDGLEDQYEYGAAAERLANEDERLDIVNGDQWRRSFHLEIEGLPTVIAICESKVAKTIIDELSSTPGMIGRYTPIAAWTPKLNLSNEQRKARKTLMLLQGSVEEVVLTYDVIVPDDTTK